MIEQGSLIPLLTEQEKVCLSDWLGNLRGGYGISEERNRLGIEAWNKFSRRNAQIFEVIPSLERFLYPEKYDSGQDGQPADNQASLV